MSCVEEDNIIAQFTCITNSIPCRRLMAVSDLMIKAPPFRRIHIRMIQIALRPCDRHGGDLSDIIGANTMSKCNICIDPMWILAEALETDEFILLPHNSFPSGSNQTWPIQFANERGRKRYGMRSRTDFGPWCRIIADFSSPAFGTGFPQLEYRHLHATDNPDCRFARVKPALADNINDAPKPVRQPHGTPPLGAAPSLCVNRDGRYHCVGKSAEGAFFLHSLMACNMADLQERAFRHESFRDRYGDLFTWRRVKSGCEPHARFRHVVGNGTIIEFLSGNQDGFAAIARSFVGHVGKDARPALFEFDTPGIVGGHGQDCGGKQLPGAFAFVSLGPIFNLTELIDRKVRHLRPSRAKSRMVAARRQGQFRARECQYLISTPWAELKESLAGTVGCQIRLTLSAAFAARTI